MTKTVLFSILLFSLVSFTSDDNCPITKVYAYFQPVLPGVSPKGPVEEGSTESKPAVNSGKSNYFIYILYKKKRSVSPTVLWIKGQGFEVRSDTISKKSVKLYNTGKTIKLVPSTCKRVVMLTPGPVLNFFAPPEPRLQALLDKNELVIEYRGSEDGEICYFPVEKIKVLETVAAE